MVALAIGVESAPAQLWLISELSGAYVCPVIDNSNLQHQNLDTIEVRVAKLTATSNPYALACVWLPSVGTGGVCGASDAGDGTLTPDLGELTDPTYASYTGYLYVYLPDDSALYDLYFEDS
jgi:hypothetical protein